MSTEEPTTRRRGPSGDRPDGRPPVRRRGFLAALIAEERTALLSLGRRQRYPAGAILFGEGDRTSRVLVLLGGRAKVSSYTEDGSEVILAVRTPEDLLGEVSAIDGLPHSATVGALEPIEAVAVDVAEFRRFLETTPRVALVLLEMAMSRLRDADRKRIEFGAYDSVGRVASRLLELAERFGEGSPERVRITLPLSQQELAGWIGASREAVSKALHVLRERGLVETGRRSVTVLDPAGLRRRAM